MNILVSWLATYREGPLQAEWGSAAAAGGEWRAASGKPRRGVGN